MRLKNGGGVWGGGGARLRLTGRWRIYFQWFFRCLFLARFWKGFFMVFLRFCEVLRVPREVIFVTILDKIEVFGEKVGPSFLHTLTAFWLDFQGPGPPGESKKREKTASEN